MAFVLSATGANGSRSSAVHRPSRLAAYFTGPGLEFHKQRVMDRRQLVLQVARLAEIAGKTGGLEHSAQARRNIGSHRNTARSAMGHETERGQVLPGKLNKILATGETLPRHPADVVGRILDADDIRQFRQPRHGLDRHVDHAAARNVVDNNRDLDGIVQRLEVLIEPLLGRLVIIGRHHQCGVRAHLPGMLAEPNGFLRGIRTASGNNRDPAGNRLNTDLGHAPMLGMGQGRRFARGSAGYDTGAALRDLPFDQIAECVFIHRALSERRD